MIKASYLKYFLASIFERLDNPAINKLCNGVYDFVEEGREMPYVTFGNMNVDKDMTKDIYGTSVTLDILVWDRDNGRERSLDITEAIETLLEDDITSDNFDLVTQNIEFIDNEEKQFGTYLTIIRFAARIEEK